MSDDASLNERRRKLEEAKLEFEEQELAIKRQKQAKELASLTQQSSSVLQLNVGGTFFDTTQATLAAGGSDSMLMRIVEGCNVDGLTVLSGASLDRDGRIFIDRDPDVFRLLLQWLRSQPLNIDAQSRNALLAEAEYFQIHRLKYYLLDEYDPFTLSPVDQTMRVQHREAIDNLRLQRPDAVAQASEMLVDVFAELGSFTFVGDTVLEHGTRAIARLFERYREERGRSEGEPIPLDAEATVEAEAAVRRAAGNADSSERRPSTSFIPSEAATLRAQAQTEQQRTSLLSASLLSARRSCFVQRLELLAGPLFQGLDMTNLVVAGGAVHRALLMGKPQDKEVIEKARKGATDIDLFIVADDEVTAQAAFERVYAHLLGRFDHVANDEADEDAEQRDVDAAEHQSGEPPFRMKEWAMLVTRSRYAVTFAAGWPQRHVQVILRRYSCVADILLQFDIDCCQLAFDGDRLWASPSARRALASGVILADPEWRSATYESRLLKYARRGYAVAVPGLDLSRVSPELTCGAFTYDQGRLKRVSYTLPDDATAPPVFQRSAEVTGLAKLVVQSAIASYKAPQKDLDADVDARERRRRQRALRAADEAVEETLEELAHSDDDDESRHRRYRYRRPLLGYSTSLGFAGPSRRMRQEDEGPQHPEALQRAYLVDVDELSERSAKEQRSVLRVLELGSLYSWPVRKRRDKRGGGGETQADADDDYSGVVLPYTESHKFGRPSQMAKHLLKRLKDRDNPLPPIVWDLVEWAGPPDADAGQPTLWEILDLVGGEPQPARAVPKLKHVLDVAAHSRDKAFYEKHLEPIGFPRCISFPSSVDSNVFARLDWQGWFERVYATEY